MALLKCQAALVCALLASACVGVKNPKSQPKLTGSRLGIAAFGLDDGVLRTPQAGYVVDLELKPVDVPGPKACPEDAYIWPNQPDCGVATPGGYSMLFGEAEPLVYSYAPAGTYEATVRVYRANAPDRVLTSAHTALNLVEAGTTIDFAVAIEAGGPALRFELRARPAQRPDGDVCERRKTPTGECSATDPLYRCSVEVESGADRRRFQDRFCDRAYLYDSLIEQICEAGLHPKESEFAASFHCDSI